MYAYINTYTYTYTYTDATDADALAARSTQPTRMRTPKSRTRRYAQRMLHASCMHA